MRSVQIQKHKRKLQIYQIRCDLFYIMTPSLRVSIDHAVIYQYDVQHACIKI